MARSRRPACPEPYARLLCWRAATMHRHWSRVTAYCLLIGGARQLDVPALVASLRRTLPSYMVPTHFVTLPPCAVPRLPIENLEERAAALAAALRAFFQRRERTGRFCTAPTPRIAICG